MNEYIILDGCHIVNSLSYIGSQEVIKALRELRDTDAQPLHKDCFILVNIDTGIHYPFTQVSINRLIHLVRYSDV